MTPKEQCEILLGNLLPFAENQLIKHGEFFPFAAVLLVDGSVKITSYYDGNECPDPKDVIENLNQLHKKMASEGKIIASGIVWNASVVSENGKPSDSIVVSLEHKEAYSIVVGKPYKIGLFKKVKFGNLFAMEGKREVFSLT